LIDRVKDSKLQQHLRELRKNPATIDHAALQLAAIADEPEVFKALLQVGVAIDESDSYGTTPLHEAVARDNLEVVKVLIDREANINQPDDDGRMPLHTVAHSKFWEREQAKNTVELLAQQPGVDFNKKYDGMPAIGIS
jgi:ankyrin repeat protein